MKKKAFILLILLVFFGGLIFSSGVETNITKISQYFKKDEQNAVSPLIGQNVRISSEESAIIKVVEDVSASVVTVSIIETRSVGRIFEVNPFDPFDVFRVRPGKDEMVEQDIGTGFVLSKNGLIVTNKHVVANTAAKYKIVTKDDKIYEVEKIFRDPLNDLAIMQINSTDLSEVVLGDSSNLKVGQLAIAIGTALGEFRNTVTVGVVSGLGRGITAGSPFEGYTERLDDVIQTDAAINPGNSGGPLLNSSGEVIGLNTAVSQAGQNIGFALPINIVKDALSQFSKTGRFQRPYLGVRYKIISRQLALINEVPQGAYVQEIVPGSPAEKAGIKPEDIITQFDDKKIIEDDGGLAKIIAEKKVGDRVSIEIWRNGETVRLTATIGEYSDE